MRQWLGPVVRPQCTVLVLHPLSSHSYCYHFMHTHIHIFFQHILAAHFTSEFLLLLADKSTDEEIFRPKTKEEEDVDILCSWVQVGGLPA